MPATRRRARHDLPEPMMPEPARFYRWLPLGVGLLAGGLALALYLGTLAPTVTFADAGELAAAVRFLDVAHPPGFPLYLLLGRLFTLLFPGGRFVLRLNAFSAVCGAAAVGLFGALLALDQEPSSGRRGAAGAAARSAAFLRALAGAGLLATSRTLWEQATLTEVYALNMALAAGLLLLLGLYRRARGRGDRRRADRLAAGTALLAGLGLGGHLTLLFIVAAVFLAIWLEEGRAFWRRWERLLLWAGLFLLGLGVYLYLPLRAAAQPPFDWGGVNTLARFWRHVSGKQYQVHFAPGPTAWANQVGFFLPRLWAEFTPLPLLLAPVGLYRLFRRGRALAWGSLVGAGLVLFYALSYEIAEDQETYFMLLFLLLALWMGQGMAQVVEWAAGRRPVRRGRPARGGRGSAGQEGGRRTAPRALLPAVLFLFLPLWPLLAQFPLCDRRAYTYAEAYARDVLDNLPGEAFVLTRDWNLFAPAYYLQQVEGVRPDVVFIDQELLRRSWYLETLARQHPWLVEGAGGALAAYRTELLKFEEGRPYDPATIQARFEALGQALLEAALARGRPAFLTGEVEYAYPVTVDERYRASFSGARLPVAGGVGDGHPWVPQALALRLGAAGEPGEEVLIQPALSDGRYHDELTRKTAAKYARYWQWRGLYLQATAGCAAAVPYYERALAVDPALEGARAGLAACRP